MYLNNNMTQSEGDDHKERLEALIESCRHIRSILETQFHPHDADNESSSYLDMNGSNNKPRHVTSDGKISSSPQK